MILNVFYISSFWEIQFDVAPLQVDNANAVWCYSLLHKSSLIKIFYFGLSWENFVSILNQNFSLSYQFSRQTFFAVNNMAYK